MEEARANGAEIDDVTINLHQVGRWDHWQGLAIQRPGNAAPDYRRARRSGTFGQHSGPLLFFFIFNAVRLAMKRYGQQLGFRKGVNIVSDMGGNVLQKLTEGASILGLFVMVRSSPNDVNQRTVGGFTNACRRWLHRHHDRAEDSSRSAARLVCWSCPDATDGSSAQQKN